LREPGHDAVEHHHPVLDGDRYDAPRAHGRLARDKVASLDDLVNREIGEGGLADQRVAQMVANLAVAHTLRRLDVQPVEDSDHLGERRARARPRRARPSSCRCAFARDSWTGRKVTHENPPPRGPIIAAAVARILIWLKRVPARAT